MFIRNLKAITAVLVLCLSFAQTSNAGQTENVEDYTFASSTSTYTALAAPTATGIGSLADVQAGKVIGAHTDVDSQSPTRAHQIGFTFQYCGQNFTEFDLGSNGAIILKGATEERFLRDDSGTVIANALFVFHDAMKTDCKYQLTGTAPNRVMTIEYYNVRWRYNETGTPNRQFQIKLHETTNVIEYVYDMVDAAFNQYNSLAASIKVFGPDKKYLSVTPGTTPSVSPDTSNNKINSTEFLKGGVTYTFTPTDVAAAVKPVATVTSDATLRNKTSFEAHWNHVSGAENYKLSVATDMAFTNLVTGYDKKEVGNLTFASVTGLTENTPYYYKVVAFNTVGDAPESNVTTARTLASGTVGTTESFDSGLPVTWTVLNNAQPANEWKPETNDGSTEAKFPTGNDGHYMTCLGTTGGFSNDWLITPVFTVDTTKDTALTYKISGGPETSRSITERRYDVKVAEAGTDVWANVYSENRGTPDVAFREVTVDLSAYKGKDVQIAFVYTGFKGSALSIDDVKVKTLDLLEVDPTEYEPGKEITIAFNNSAATTTDWIAIYKETTVPAAGNSESWNYLNNTQTAPTAPVTSGTVKLNAPSAEGTYKIVYHVNGGYTFDATKAIQITVKIKVPEKVTAKGATLPTKTGFTANWDATTAVTSPVTGYKLFVATDQAFTNLVTNYGPKELGVVTTEPVTGLTIGTTYYYKVVAKNAGGDSVDSNTITTQTVSAELIVTDKTLYEPGNQVRITFNNAASQVRDWIAIYKEATTSPAAPGSSEDWNYLNNTRTAPTAPVRTGIVTLTAPTAPGRYKVVYHVNNGYDFDSTKVVNFEVKIKVPVEVKAIAGTLPSQTSFTANWEAAVATTSPVTGYKLYVSTDAACASNFVTGYSPKEITGKDVVSAAVTGLTKKTTYYYKVVVVNAGGDSPDSNIITTVTLDSPLIMITGAVFKPGQDIPVTFDSPAATATDRIGIYEQNTVPASGNNKGLNYLNNSQTAPATAVTSGTVTLKAPATPGDYKVIYHPGTEYTFEPQNVILIKIVAPVEVTEATKPTKTGFQANWKAMTGATAYKLFVSTDPAFGNLLPGYGPKTLAAGTIFETFTGLTENTSYYYKVVATVAGVDIPESSTITARTVGTGVLGVAESFTAGIPDTWAVLDKDKDAKTWIAQTNDGTDTKFPTGNDGHYVSCLSAVGIQGDNWLISPAFTIDATAGATLSYKVTNGYEGVQADVLTKHHRVMVTLVGSGVWEELLTDSLTNSTTGFRVITEYIDQAKYLGKDIQIAFVYDSKDGLALSIDDVLVENTKLITTGSQVAYEAGSAIAVTFKNNGSAVGDRIAIYKKSNTLTSPTKGGYIDIKYLNNTANPPIAIAPATTAVSVTEGTVMLNAPTAAGEYRIVYLLNGGFTFDPATAVDITVTPKAAVTIDAGILAGHTSFTALWTATVGATGYRLFVSTDPACNGSFLPSYGPLEVGAITAQDVVGVIDTNTYYYKVVALSGNLVAPASNITKVEPLLITPAYGVSTKLEGQTLSWSVDYEDGVVAYRVEQEVNGKWITVTSVAASGEAGTKYNVTVGDKQANYRIVSVDSNGLTQAFGVNNDSTLFVSLKAGWNLISVPVNNADLSGINGTIWSWDGEKYVAAETAQAKQGLWVYSTTTKDLTITGTPTSDTTVAMKQGWNLVGPLNNCTAPTGFSIYTWNNAYSQILNRGGLIRGTGYWFFSKKPQKLDLK